MHTYSDAKYWGERRKATNKEHGRGVMIFESGNMYEGYWRNCLRHDKGRFILNHSGEIYEGQWKDGKKNGHGVYKFADGSVY